MIVRKTWERFAKDRHGVGGGRDSANYLDTYTGWYLLGFIPLFISRSRARR